MYDMPDEIDVKADGALRIITLNRPDALNAVNDNLHVVLAKIWEALNEDTGARAAVITGAGRAFSAGGDFNYLDELRNDEALRVDPLEELERLYKVADAAAREDPAVLEAARAELVKLQAGDPENRGLWEQIVAISSRAFHQIYDRLEVRFDHEYGERFYNGKV